MMVSERSDGESRSEMVRCEVGLEEGGWRVGWGD